MTKFWIRRAKVTVGGSALKLDDLQAEFQVRQTDIQHPDWAYIRITNLSIASSQKLFDAGKGGSFELEAGYHEGYYGSIFKGEIMQQRRGKANGTDKYHDILAVSGGRGYSNATVSQTLPAGSKTDDLVNAVVQALAPYGITRGYISQFGDQATKRGVTLNDPARDILRRLAETGDASWYIQDNKLYIVKTQDFVPGEGLKIGPTTGMVGIPEQQLNGIVVRVLMRPDVLVGQKIQLDPQTIKQYLSPVGEQGGFDIKSAQGVIPGIPVDGVFKVVRIDQDGSVQGQEWYTTITALDMRNAGMAAGAAGNQGTPMVGSNVPEVKTQDGKGQRQ
jgi:hypothetical protein